jgi:hypothetical protein
MHVGRHSLVHVVGGDFFQLPGTYVLPFREGTYTITGDSEVLFNSRSSGTAYKHQLVSYPEPSFKMDYGWYSVFFDFRMTKDLKIKIAPKFGYNTTRSI